MLKQLLCAIVIMAAVINIASAETIVLGEKGNESITMTYIVTQEDEAMRVRFRMKKDKKLEFNRSAVAVCFQTDENNELQTGAKGFGLNYSCTVEDGCKYGSDLVYAFFASELKSTDPPTWAATSTDMSAANRGSVNPGSGIDFTTRYGLTEEQVEQSHLPKLGEQSFLKCFTAYDVSYDDVRIWTEIELTDDIFNEEEKSFTVNEGELSEELEYSGAIQQVLPIGILSMLVAFFTIF